MRDMTSKRVIMSICLLFSLIHVIVAEGVDLTGTWESHYQFGPMEEVMTSTIQQVGNNILGSFLVKPFIGPERSGTIFGTVEGDRAKVSLLSVKKSGRSDLLMTMTFIDGRIVDENTLTGTFYVYDNEGTALSGSYEATRK
jgi:hypothetical protein